MTIIRLIPKTGRSFKYQYVKEHFVHLVIFEYLLCFGFSEQSTNSAQGRLSRECTLETEADLEFETSLGNLMRLYCTIK